MGFGAEGLGFPPPRLHVTRTGRWPASAPSDQAREVWAPQAVGSERQLRRKVAELLCARLASQAGREATGITPRPPSTPLLSSGPTFTGDMPFL